MQETTLKLKVEHSNSRALVAGILLSCISVGAGFAGGLAFGHSPADARPEAPVAVVAEVSAEELEGLDDFDPALVANEVLSDEVALEEARALGLLDAVRETRPTLRNGIVERLGIAFVREAHRNGLDPLLLAAVARVESHYNPFATSSVGARGVLQVRPITGRWMLSYDNEELIDDGELYDLETNVQLGARYLASLMTRMKTLEDALVAYNRGARGARIALSGPDRKAVLAGYPRKVLRAKAGLERRGVVAALDTPNGEPRL